MLKAKSYKLKAQNGYIALVSAIVISVLLLAITLSLGFSGFFGRFNILDSESKEMSKALAEACVDQAILESFYGTYYATIADFSIPTTGYICKRSSDLANNEIIIEAQGEFNKSFTNLKVIVNSFTFDINSYKECPNFDASC